MADIAELGLNVNSSQVKTADSQLQHFNQTAQNTDRRVTRLNTSFGRLRDLGRTLTRALAPLGLAIGLGAAVNTLASFSQEMSTVRAVSGATEMQFAALSEEARNLGATTRFTATQAAEGMTFLARAGFNADQVLQSTGATLILAQAGALDLGRAADIASNVLQGFRLQAEQTNRVVDVLALTANKSNTDVEQLGNAMSFLAPAAAAVGVEVEQAAAAVGVLSNAGIQSTRAGTGLRQIFVQLLNPTGEARDLLASLGLTLADVDIESRGLVPVLESLRDANVGLSEAATLVGTRQATSLLVLLDSIENMEALTRANQNAAGTAEEVARIMDENLNGALLATRSATEAIVLAFGELGAQSALTQFFFGLASVLRQVADNIEIVTNVAAGLATFLLTRFVASFVVAQGGVLGLVGALRGLTAALLLNPLIAIPAAIALAVTGFLELRRIIREVTGNIPDLGTVFQVTFGLIRQVINDLLGRLGTIGDAIVALLEGEFSLAGELAGDAFTREFNVSIDRAIAEAGAARDRAVARGRLRQVRQNLAGTGALGDETDDQEDDPARAVFEQADALRQLQDRLDPVGAATRELAEGQTLLNQAYDAGKISIEERDSLLISLNESLRDQLDPMAAVQRALQEEADLVALTNDERRIEEQLIGIVNELRDAGVQLTMAETNALRDQLTVMDEVAQRRERELALLERIQGPMRRNIEDLEALNAVRSQLTDEQFETELRRIMQAQAETQNTVGAGFERAFLDMEAQVADVAGTVQHAFGEAFDAAGDAISDFVQTGKIDLQSLVADVSSSLIKLGLQQAFVGGGNLFGFGAGVSSGGLGIGSLFGFANGGEFTVGGIGGRDRNVMSINGQPVAAVSRGEQVNVMPQGQGGGVNVTMIVQTQDADSFRRSETQIANRTAALIERANRRR